MKKLVLVITLLIVSFTFSQERTADIFSIKAGIIGGWISYEKAVSPKMTLNAEVGYEGGFYHSNWTADDVDYVLTTTLSLEGRYYYNFNRRLKKGKNISNNSANFVAVETTFTPDWGTSKSADNIDVLTTFTVFSKYGLRRKLSKRFNFELTFGPGYQWVEDGDNGVILGLDARFGYIF
ncbi:MAG: hypothetical protein ACK5IC_06290 [Moheibacter sp.]